MEKASPGRDNNFNLIRFVLASLVILSHSFEFADGNRRREPLTRIFGTLSLGDLAVGCFFLLSGFLIVQSWQRKPVLFDFLKKRVLRIYPGFIVATLFSALVAGPLGAEPNRYFAALDWGLLGRRMLKLQYPEVPPVFQGQAFAGVNGSMWTIEYEFRCYILVALLGILGLMRRRRWWMLLAGVALSLSLLPQFVTTMAKHATFPGHALLLLDPLKLIPLLACFCAGGCFFLFRDRIVYRTRWAILAAMPFVAGLFYLKTAYFVIAVFGGYLLFWFAFAQVAILSSFRRLPDVSYGVYLYGWPLQKLLHWYIPALSPWLLFFSGWILSCGFGLLSWHLVEHPFLRLKKTESRA